MNDSSITPPGRAPDNSSASEASGPSASGFERAMNALRLALPLVQRLLPLLDGNVGSAVANFMNPPPQPPPPPPVNLEPLEDGLARLQADHHGLRGQVLEQSESLKRVEDQLVLVSKAADRNTLAQQELMEELKAVSKKMEALKAVRQTVKLFGWAALCLLAISIVLNGILLRIVLR